MGGIWSYSGCFVGCCFQDLFRIARSILVQLESSFFFIRLVSAHMGLPCRRIDVAADWKILCFILSDKFEFQMIDNLSIALHDFASHILMSFSVDKMQLPWYVNLSTSFREPPFSVEMFPIWKKTNKKTNSYTPFCQQWHGGQCHLLLAPDNRAGIRHWWVFLPEAYCHQRYLCL